MTDINLSGSDERLPVAGGALPQGEIVELIELLFFAYRDFVADPDEILQDFGFGRAHHRIIHFVARNPGMRVAELLDILRITKQSLGRVLRELIDKGFVFQREGATDRRQRLLYLTDDGKELHDRLIKPQIARFETALADAGPEAAEHYREVLFNLVNVRDREHVAQLTAAARPRIGHGDR